MQIKIRKSRFWNLIKISFPDVDMDNMWLTFNQTIWCPPIGITEDLIAHETVHGSQQKNFVFAIYWWYRYLTDKKFRLKQEIPAYRRQFLVICRTYHDRNTRIKHRVNIARLMSGPMYNHMVDYDTAFKSLEL